MVRSQTMAEPQQQPVASPLRGFRIPDGTKMPQTQADLAVYVKSLLAQMVSGLECAVIGPLAFANGSQWFRGVEGDAPAPASLDVGP